LGDPVKLAVKYMNEGADELVFLNISASWEKGKTNENWIKEVADKLSIPFIVAAAWTRLKGLQASRRSERARSP